MKSSTTPRFWNSFSELPVEIRLAAEKQYRHWKKEPLHPSLHFKNVGPFWSVRITEEYRALALKKDNKVYWFWIGRHQDYEKIIKRK